MSKQKRSVLVWAVAVAIIIAVGIYYFYVNNNSNVTHSTYSNSEYNFQISYPNDWVQKPFTYEGIAKVTGGIATLENNTGSVVQLINSSEGCYGSDWKWVGDYFRNIKCVQAGSKIITIDAGTTNEIEKTAVDSIINSFEAIDQ